MKKLYCRDNQSFYKVSPNGKIRYIQMPEDRAYLVGQLSQDGTLVVLYKKEQHHNVAVPSELLSGLPDVTTWVVKTMGTSRLLQASTSLLKTFGYIPNVNNSSAQQYLISDRGVWSEFFSIVKEQQYASPRRA